METQTKSNAQRIKELEDMMQEERERRDKYKSSDSSYAICNIMIESFAREIIELQK